MELTDAREMFEATVNVMLQDTAIGTGVGSVHETAHRYIRDMNPDVFTILVDAINVLQAAGAISLHYDSITTTMDGNLVDVVRRYVRCLLVQEGLKALRLSMDRDGTIKVGQ